MNIYFAGAIRGGRDDSATYRKLIKLLQIYGKVLTEHVGDEELLQQEQFLSEKEIFARDMKWLAAADLLIAEVTTPSLGVGYELAVAEKRGLPCLCLFHKQPHRTLSAMISGNSFFQTVTYKDHTELIAIVEQFMQQFTRKMPAQK